ncbi:hypothetical protein chiPu_0033172, partial [Chiloscyllium punctatum]|nr:hypothetical protein [Chiloscyllium punctatum]
MSGSALKQELKLLESIFHQRHERFRIVSGSLDEISCQFVTQEQILLIHCNIT